MCNAMFEELKQISAEMKNIVNKSKVDSRQTNQEKQELLDLLATDREELLSRIIFHGDGSNSTIEISTVVHK